MKKLMFLLIIGVIAMCAVAKDDVLPAAVSYESKEDKGKVAEKAVVEVTDIVLTA